jgi:pimeloyl-ACP methyl ester carboxylesterase
MISLHGIGVETEFWPPGYEALGTLLDNGVRLVFPDGPWHGRRRPSGYFGGEPIIAQAPEGMLTCMQAWSAEVAMLIAWSRTSGSPMVAVGGISLGALTSQMVASVSAAWPKFLQPDALFLVATSNDLLGVVFDGTLTGGVGLSRELKRAGWTRGNLRDWLPLLEPQGPPLTGPDRVVMVLGEADTVTPFAGGFDLAQRWGVPADNLFIRHQGHFSVALGLATDPAPVNRLLALMRE